MRPHTLIVLILLLLAAPGCPTGKPGPKPVVTPNLPLQAPPPPPVRNVALDPALAAAADRELSQALRNSDPVIRAHALEGMRDCNSSRHKPDILRALHDTEAFVRFAAALAAGELRMQEAHDTLAAMADDRSPNVRVAVRFALHSLGDTRLSHQLEHMAVDNNSLVKGNTAMVLGLLGDKSALPILRVLATDREAAVRQNAAEAMWRLGDEEGLEELVGLTSSRFPDDQAMGYLGLAAPRNTRIRQHVRAGLAGDQSYPEVSLVAARAMGMLGSDEGYAVAVKGAESSDARQRVLAARALGAIGRSDAQDLLGKLLADSNADVRIAAATGILQLKPPG